MNFDYYIQLCELHVREIFFYSEGGSGIRSSGIYYISNM